MSKRKKPVLALGLAWWCGLGALAAASAAPSPLFCACREDNDIYRVLTVGVGQILPRYDTPSAAVAAATPSSGVLLLADGYPDRTTVLDAELFARAAEKKLRLYVEFPGFLPGLTVEAPRSVVWERGVVTSDLFGPGLPPGRILSAQNCRFVPAQAPQGHLVLARVAGYDRAVFGLPEQVYPLLFELSPGENHGAVLVATTQLSRPITGRFGPVPAWQTVWHAILAWLVPDRQIELQWISTVRPAMDRDRPVSPELELDALQRGVEWFVTSRLLLASSRTNEVAQLAASGKAPAPSAQEPVGDGSFGILEGYLSWIQPDGSQLQSLALRGDCNAESAMALAFGGKVTGQNRYSDIARNLLDFYLFTSDARRGDRGNPAHGAFGLVAWGVSTPAWSRANYGDDNARLLLGAMAVSALLEEDRWDEAMLQCLLANLRTTGPLGFRGDRIDLPELTERGWQHFFQRRITNYAPHYESYLWACYLWAYHKTHFDLFLERAKSAIRRTMAAYPDRWRWTNGLQQERARMLLCLSWLTRLEDTPEHRAWLRRLAEDLLALQDDCGAIREEIGDLKRGQLRPPNSNAAYGTGETPLLQENGDPVCDLLYTCNFALLGLHEAAAATGDPFYRKAEDRLAAFLCRIQARSERHPELDGGWFRAFDFRVWDYWASNADAGWGAWSIESGWTQGWITSVLALRHLKTSLWEVTADSHMARHLARWRPRMIPDSALTFLSTNLVQHAALHRTVTLETKPSEMYPGDGPASLTDGTLGEMDHTDTAWLGFWQDDLVATLDLGAATNLRELRASFLQNVGLGIFLPRQVAFLAGDDPARMQVLHTARPAAEETEAGPFRETFAAKNLQVQARYVTVRATNMKRIPSWHPAAGQKAWLFVDEVLVNPAPD